MLVMAKPNEELALPMRVSFPKLSDEELACEVQAGCLDAFEELALRYERRIFGFLRQKTTYSDAEDLTQRTFIMAYQRIHQYNPTYKFATWLFTIARRLAISHYRNTSKKKLESLEVEVQDNRAPSDAISQRESVGRLWAISKAELSEDQHTAMWLKYREELKIDEIAAVMGRTVSSVKVLLHRGRKLLATKVNRES